jgi:flagellar biosynthetic protein FliR
VPWLLFGMAMGREVLLGALVGLIFGLFLAPIHIAGEFITQQIGLAQATLVGGATSSAGGPLTIILETLGGMAFLALDGHHVILAVLHASFGRYPLGGTFMPVPAETAVEGVTTATSLGILLAGPLALALFLVTATLALMGRVAPQLNIYSVGFALQALVAILAGMLLIPDMVGFMTVIFGRIGELVRVLL